MNTDNWSVHVLNVGTKLAAMRDGHYSRPCVGCHGTGYTRRRPRAVPKSNRPWPRVRARLINVWYGLRLHLTLHRCPTCHGSRYQPIEGTRALAEYMLIELKYLADELQRRESAARLLLDHGLRVEGPPRSVHRE